jgi:hypothetical protein
MVQLDMGVIKIPALDTMLQCVKNDKQKRDLRVIKKAAARCAASTSWPHPLAQVSRKLTTAT